MFTNLRNKFQVWWLQAVYGMVASGFVVLLYSYFVKSQLNFSYIILAEALGYGGAALFIILKKQFEAPFDLRLGFLLILASLFLLFLPFSPLVVLFIYTIVRISGVIMFFVPYNILFFRSTQESKRLHKMTVMWSIGSVVGIIAPIIGGYIFFRFGVGIFVGIAIGILCLALFLTLFIKKEVYKYKFIEVITHLKGVRTTTMIDGASENISGILITLYLLSFIKDEFDFGKLLSVIALMSIIFSFKLASFSDKYNKRFEFIWPLSFLSAVIMISFYFVSSFWAVIILVILFKFVSTLLNPVRSNIILDKIDNVPLTWIARDVFLNVGRALALFFVFVISYYGFLNESFIFAGLLFAIFPFIVYRKKIYSRQPTNQGL